MDSALPREDREPTPPSAWPYCRDCGTTEAKGWYRADLAHRVAYRCPRCAEARATPPAAAPAEGAPTAFNGWLHGGKDFGGDAPPAPSPNDGWAERVIGKWPIPVTDAELLAATSPASPALEGGAPNTHSDDFLTCRACEAMRAVGCQTDTVAYAHEGGGVPQRVQRDEEPRR